MELIISLLGIPQIEVDGRNVNGRLPAKARTLLYYLAGNRQTHSRDQLAEWFWAGAADSRASLRGAVNAIRKELGKEFLTGGRDDLAVNQNVDFQLDVEEFDHYIRLAQKVSGAAERAYLREAVELYRGDFLQEIALDNLYLNDVWLIPERERLRQQALTAYDRLVDICREQADYEAGIIHAQALLQIEDWRESAHRHLMWFYDRLGRRAQALNQFDILEEVLAERFDVSPTEESFALYRQIMAGEVVEEAAAAPEKPAVPFLVPKLLPFFSGRDGELTDLQERLWPRETRQSVGLVGPPGVGKTALAIELAHRLRDAFPDGVLWMNADLDDPMSVAERWASAYGHDYSRISDVNERTAVLRELLAEKQALIICDDVTNAAQTRLFLPEKGRSTILLTSRSENLIRRLGARLVNVPVMSLVNGRTLLASIISEERVAAEEEAAAEIITLLEGLPLAIAIAGQRLAQQPRRKLALFAAQLGDESARIDLADKDRAVRTSFTVSWNGLDQIQRGVFARLAVFAGRSFAVDAVTAIAEMDYFEALDRLDALVALSLLNDVGDERYRQHALLADFAREKLGDDDGPYRRMITYYQAFAAGHNEDYAALELEWENLSVSIDKAHEMALWPAVLALTDMLQPAWFRRGRYFEARRAFPLSVAAAKALNDQPALARYLFHWGYICWEQNDWDEAKEKLTVSMALFESLGDLAGVAKAQLHLGQLSKDQADFIEAEQYFAASRRVMEDLDDQRGIAETIRLQGHLQDSCGNYEVARQLYEQSLNIFEALNDKMGILQALRSLARTLRILGQDLDLIKAYYERANQLTIELEDQVEKVVIKLELANIYLQQGEYQKAKKTALKSLEMRRKLGDRRGEAMVYFVLSEISQRQQNYQDALQYCEQSLSLCRTLSDKNGIAFSLQRMGDVWECLNQFQKARKMWREALEIARRIQHQTLTVDLQARLEKYSE